MDDHGAYAAILRSPYLSGLVDWLIAEKRLRGLLTACVTAHREREAVELARRYLRRWQPEKAEALFGAQAPADGAALAVQAALDSEA